jgi:uncharacterized protein YggU (UPF0235/DUF167 family)
VSANPFFPFVNKTKYEIDRLPQIDKMTIVEKETKKKKIKVKSITGNENDELVKFLGKDLTFPFKNIKECLTSDSKKKYYVSRKDLIEQIKNDPEIAKYFPKALLKSTATKKDICDNIFQE